MIQKYKKKPVEVDAVQWNENNLIEVIAFLRNTSIAKIHSEINNSDLSRKNWKNYESQLSHKGITIATLKGDETAYIGYYIIKKDDGSFYPCSGDEFKKLYEPIN